MDIFEFAMEKEKFSEDYYRQLAEKTNHPGLSNICKMLADEEVKHFKTVQNMQNAAVEDVTKTPVLKNAKDIFESMRKSTEKFDLDVSELELYQKARHIEEQARKFYLEKADEVENPEQKEIFKKLAKEEGKHYFLIDNICDFVEKPKWFLENAEIYRFEDYVNGVL